MCYCQVHVVRRIRGSYEHRMVYHGLRLVDVRRVPGGGLLVFGNEWARIEVFLGVDELRGIKSFIDELRSKGVI